MRRLQVYREGSFQVGVEEGSRRQALGGVSGAVHQTLPVGIDGRVDRGCGNVCRLAAAQGVFLAQGEAGPVQPPVVGAGIRPAGELKQVGSLRERLSQAFAIPAEKLAPLHSVEHHLAHIASAFFCSPYVPHG